MDERGYYLNLLRFFPPFLPSTGADGVVGG
jgi:hypothetical protein